MGATFTIMDFPIRSLSETARVWAREHPDRGCSYACIRKWAVQDRIEVVRDDSGRIVGVPINASPPDRVRRGGLSEVQRAAWPRARRAG